MFRRIKCITQITLLLIALWVVSSGQSTLAGGSYVTLLANMDGAQEVPSVETGASGSAVFVLDTDGVTLHYRLMVENIDEISGAHIHDGDFGASGGIVVGLDATTLAPGSPTSGSVMLTLAQATELQAGGYYVNVHTEEFAGGEIRGQINVHSFDTVGAVLDADNEVPPVASAATGVARFSRVSVDSYDYEIAVNDNAGDVSVGHLHTGSAGNTGGPVVTLNVADLDTDEPVSGNAGIPDAQTLLDFLTGFLYVNIHTTEFGGGEMRGQTMPTDLLIFKAELDGAQENPPVDTPATGLSIAVVDADWQTTHIRVVVENLDVATISNSHVHEAPVGSNGGVQFGLGGDYSDNDLENSFTMMIDDLADLIASRFYVNVHTSEHGGGEIRGQLEPFAPEDKVVTLSGSAEVPPVATTATGTTRFFFNTSSKIGFALDVMNITDPTMAHIHEGIAGTNGGVIFALYSAARDVQADLNVDGLIEVDAAQLSKMLSGKYYVNVHTSANPGGELRGQIPVVPMTPTAVAMSQTGTAPAQAVWLWLVVGLFVLTAAVMRRPAND